MSVANNLDFKTIVKPVLGAFQAYSDQITSSFLFEKEGIEKTVEELKSKVFQEIALLTEELHQKLTEELHQKPHDQAEKFLENLPEKINRLWKEFQVKLMDHFVKQLISNCEYLKERVKKEDYHIKQEDIEKIEVIVKKILNLLSELKEIDTNIDNVHLLNIKKIGDVEKTLKQIKADQPEEIAKDLQSVIDRINKVSKKLTIHLTTYTITHYNSLGEKILKSQTASASEIDKLDELDIPNEELVGMVKKEEIVFNLERLNLMSLVMKKCVISLGLIEIIYAIEFPEIFRDIKILLNIYRQGQVNGKEEQIKNMLSNLLKSKEDLLKKQATLESEPKKSRIKNLIGNIDMLNRVFSNLS